MKIVLLHADFVIEGYVDPRGPLRLSACGHAQAGNEGPFADHTGYYTLPEPYPVFHVTAITHRKDAVYPATIVGIPQMRKSGGQSVNLAHFCSAARKAADTSCGTPAFQQRLTRLTCPSFSS